MALNYFNVISRILINAVNENCVKIAENVDLFILFKSNEDSKTVIVLFLDNTYLTPYILKSTKIKPINLFSFRKNIKNRFYRKRGIFNKIDAEIKNPRKFWDDA